MLMGPFNSTDCDECYLALKRMRRMQVPFNCLTTRLESYSSAPGYA